MCSPRPFSRPSVPDLWGLDKQGPTWILQTLQFIKIILCIYIMHHNILLGVQQSIQHPISTPVTTNTQSLLSSDQQHHSMSPSEWITLIVFVHYYSTTDVHNALHTVNGA